MRIGMDVRFLSHPQTGGFKTYVQGVMAGLAQADKENDYFLYTDRPIQSEKLGPVPKRAQVVLAQPRISGPGLILREQWDLRRLAKRDHIDLFHFPTNTGCLRAPCPFVLTLHDTIELEGNPWEGNRPFLEGIRRRSMTAYGKICSARAVRQAQRIITVSGHVRDRAVRYFRMQPDRFTPIHSGPGSPPLPLSPGDRDALLSRHSLSAGYVLALTGVDRRKNALGVLEGYLALPVHLRANHPLVFVAPRRSQARSWLSLPNTIHVVEGPDELDMAGLYQGAEVFLFPSFDEGFGFPPLEAMGYGIPVIASEIPSHKELLAEAPLWVNPTRPKDIVEALERVLLDSGLREAMAHRGKLQAGTLSWEQTGRSVLELYETAATRGRAT